MSQFGYRTILAIVVIQATVLTLNVSLLLLQGVNLLAAAIIAWILSGLTGRRSDLLVVFALGWSAPLIDLAIPWGAAPLWLNLLKEALYVGFAAYIAYRIFVTIYDADAITQDEIAGAIAVYALLAVLFADIYEAIGLLLPGAIQWGNNFGAIEFGEYLYFSFITMATVGFGDVAPARPIARVVVVLQAVTGMMYMAILVARFVSLHTTSNISPRRDTDSLGP